MTVAFRSSTMPLSIADVREFIDGFEEGESITIRALQFKKEVMLSGFFTRANGIPAVINEDKTVERVIFDDNIDHTVFLEIHNRKNKRVGSRSASEQPNRSQPPPAAPAAAPAAAAPAAAATAATAPAAPSVAQPAVPRSTPLDRAANNETFRMELELERAKQRTLELQIEVRRSENAPRPESAPLPAPVQQTDLLVSTLTSDHLRDTVSGDNRPRRYLTYGDHRLSIKDGGADSQQLDATKRMAVSENLETWRNALHARVGREMRMFRNRVADPIEIDIERKVDQVIRQVQHMRDLQLSGHTLGNKDDWEILLRLNFELFGKFAYVRGNYEKAARVVNLLYDQLLNNNIDYDGAWKVVFPSSASA